MTVIFPPCTEWITSEDAAAYCGLAGSDASRLDDYVLEASQLLFELSGRQFNGVCTDTVRPCRTGCGCWNLSILTGGVLSPGAWPDAWGFGFGYGPGFGWGGLGWLTSGGDICGCGCLSQIELPGFPVAAISTVKVDGVTVDASKYRIDEQRFLVRLRDDPDQESFWPACQILDLPDTEPGTWSVEYTYGVAPPQAGIAAAKQLTCELYKADTGGDCAIPRRATRIQRAGVTVDMLVLNWLKGQNTGLVHVDSFLNAYNPQRIRRRAAFYSPDHSRYGRHVGE